MPDYAASVFLLEAVWKTVMGTMIYSSLPGGCSYEKFFTDILLGGFLALPMNFLEPCGYQQFPRRDAKEPIGEQMRQECDRAGSRYVECQIFGNYDGNVDLYFRQSTWPADIWLCYELNVAAPALWYAATTMTYKRRVSWPMPPAQPIRQSDPMNRIARVVNHIKHKL